MKFLTSPLAYLAGILLLVAVIIYILISPGFSNEPPPSATPQPSPSTPTATPGPSDSPTAVPSLQGKLEDVLLDPTVIAGEWVLLSNAEVKPFSNELLSDITLDLQQTPTRGIWRSLPGGSNGSVSTAYEMVLVFGTVPTATDAYADLADQLTTAGLAPSAITFADASYMSFNADKDAAIFLNRVGHKLYLLYFALDDGPERFVELLQQWASITNGRLARL